MINQPILGGCLPDAGRPGTHVDALIDDHVDKIQAVAASVVNPIVEIDGILDLRPWCSPVENQSTASSCTANATVGALEFLQIRNGLPFVDLSRLFIYYNARLMNQDQTKDGGSYISLAFNTLMTLGTCTEKTWPYDLAQLFTRPSWKSYQEGCAHKIANFYRITAESGQPLVDAIKQALQAQHCVVFGMLIDEDYVNIARDGMVAMPKAQRVNSGGHAQAIVGYNDNTRCWIVRNSWGTGWGDGGYAHCPYEYLDVSQAFDFWIPSL